MQSSTPMERLPEPLEDELRWLRRLSLPLRTAALALFLSFAVGVLAANFPPRWDDPSWYLSASVTLVNGATLPLMGLCLLQLVAFLERGLAIEQALLERARYLALWVALGFLLLLPVQAWTSWRVLELAAARDASQARLANRAFDRLDRLGHGDQAAPDLRRELEAIPGLRLPFDFFSQPVPEQRRKLRANASRGRTQVIEQAVARRNQRLLALARNWLRVPISCLGYAVAFGAFARRSGTSRPLYEELGQLWHQLRLSRLRDWLEEQERLAELEEQERQREVLGRLPPPGSRPRPGSGEQDGDWDDDDPALPRP